jgi:hypothetical protein
MGWKNIMKNFIVTLYWDKKRSLYFVKAKDHSDAQIKATEYFYKHRYNALVKPHRIDSHYIRKNIKVEWLGDF